jgi:hypothetical protein
MDNMLREQLFPVKHPMNKPVSDLIFKFPRPLTTHAPEVQKLFDHIAEGEAESVAVAGQHRRDVARIGGATPESFLRDRSPVKLAGRRRRRAGEVRASQAEARQRGGRCGAGQQGSS